MIVGSRIRIRFWIDGLLQWAEMYPTATIIDCARMCTFDDETMRLLGRALTLRLQNEGYQVLDMDLGEQGEFGDRIFNVKVQLPSKLVDNFLRQMMKGNDDAE